MRTTWECYYVQNGKVEIAYIAAKTKEDAEKFIWSLGSVSEIVNIKKWM
jgi:hypothetical protein